MLDREVPEEDEVLKGATAAARDLVKRSQSA
jgi:hypothetical protein